MIVINLYAGPGAGKSTTAAAVFAALKRLDINCELVTEYAKDCTWAGGSKVFQDQVYLLGKQHWRLFRLKDEVDVVVTDAPLLLSTVYNRLYAKYKHLDELALEAYERYNNRNYFLVRSKVYNPKGRNQTEEEAKGIDVLTREILHEFGLPLTDIDYTTAEDVIVNDVLEHLGRPTKDWKDRLAQRYPGIFTAPHWRDTGENPERIPVPLSVGDGWAKLISDLADELDDIWRELPSEARNGIYLMQCKEKFGGLRVYLSQGTDRMFDAIQRVENASFRVCEECGRTGRIRNGGWIRTLCDKCVEKTGYKEHDHDDSDRA